MIYSGSVLLHLAFCYRILLWAGCVCFFQVVFGDLIVEFWVCDLMCFRDFFGLEE